MKIFNLHLSIKAKIDSEIKTSCGGRIQKSFSTWLVASGAGGLTFEDPFFGAENERSFKVNFELFRNGIGIYFRNYTANYLITIPEKEIVQIKLTKKPDIIAPSRLSLFRMMSKSGIPYHISRISLLENEIFEEHPLEIFLETTQNTFKFTSGLNTSTEKWTSFFNHQMFADKVKSELKIVEFSNIF
ncbi:MAG: hypothetical protein IPM42_17025 [Saprospiraceae bacterium]|nr:hypothetical protein [Saprospiraceae bacterium]